MTRLRVAFVAPSLAILGGQAVQADRLLRAWRDDGDVDAFLVPVNPEPPRPLRFATRVKYLRTIVNRARSMGRCLLRELARADVVHVFSASYSSFLLAPLPAILVARALGRPVVLNYRSGQAPDHLRRSAIARTAIASADLNVVPSTFLVDVFRRIRHRRDHHPEHRRSGALPVSRARSRCGRGWCRRETSSPCTTSRRRCARSGSSRTGGRTHR